MNMINVNGFRGPAVEKVEVAKAPRLVNTTVEAVEGSKTDTNRAVEKVRAALKASGADIPAQASLSIRVDRDANRYVYEFRDPESNKVIRQYPDKEVLAALAAHRHDSTGITIDEVA